MTDQTETPKLEDWEPEDTIAAYLGITVASLRHQRGIRSALMGSKRIYRKADVAAWLLARRDRE